MQHCLPTLCEVQSLPHMGWYLRKSFGFGPLRLNLSKSGLGASIGVRGARIGVGPRGNYVRLGRGGVYYQKYFSTANPTPASSPNSVLPEAIEPGTPVLSADVAQLHDTTSERLLQEIQQKQRKLRFAPMIAILSGLLILGLLAGEVSIWIPVVLIPVLAVLHAYVARHDYESKLVVLNYDLDSDARTKYVALLTAIQWLASSTRIWRVVRKQEGVDTKYHGGAGTTQDRTQVYLRRAAPRYIQTQLALWSVPLGDQTLYLFPDRMLVYQGDQVGAVDYSSLTVDVRHISFVEDEAVPPDSQVVGQTWQFVNRDGGPDRRFSNNRQLPVVLYYQTWLRSTSGLNILLESSDPQKAAHFVDGLKQYIGARQSATADERTNPKQHDD